MKLTATIKILSLLILLFSASALFALGDNNIIESTPLDKLEKANSDQALLGDGPMLGAVDMNTQHIVIFNPQANEMADDQAPIYFHYKSNPQAICKKYDFSNYKKDSVIFAYADFNYDYIVVDAYEFKDELRFTIPKKNQLNTDHLKMISEISCY